MVHATNNNTEENKERRRPLYVIMCIVIMTIVIGLGYVISTQMKDGSVLRGGWSLMQDFSGYNRRPERPEVNLCFPAHATVECKQGNKAMCDLCVGDTIRSGTGWSEIYAFMDACPASAKYLIIQSESGHSLTISPRHFIYVTRINTGISISMEACEIRVGDYISIAGEDDSALTRLSKVIQCDEVDAMGYYAPLTLDGSMFVDGVFVSCYASCPNIDILGISGADVLHRLHAPLRKIYDFHPSISSEAWHTNTGRHLYTEGLRGFGSLFRLVT